jgi:hypothetical protein
MVTRRRGLNGPIRLNAEQHSLNQRAEVDAIKPQHAQPVLSSRPQKPQNLARRLIGNEDGD